MPQLKAKVENLNHSVTLQRRVHRVKVKGFRVAHQLKVERLRSAHLMELELKDSFCEAEKVYVLIEVQASFTSKLPGLYDE